MKQSVFQKIATAFLILTCIVPFLAALTLPDPFRWSEMIAAPAIVGEIFVNYIFNVPSMALTITFFATGIEMSKRGRRKSSSALLGLSILSSIFGIAFMIYRSTIYS